MANKTETAVSKKKLGAIDLFLGIIVFMLWLDSGTAASAMGINGIIWYVILAVVFFLPMALVNAELGSTYPSDGGLYHWVNISIGADNACRTTWYYWLNNALCCASASIFIMDVICNMLTMLTGIEVSFTVYLILSCLLVWVFVFVAIRPHNESILVRNISGIAKLAIVVAVAICAIVFLFKNGGHSATPITAADFRPTIGAAFVFFPALIYNVVGFDAISAVAGEKIKNPGKDLPRMMLLSLVLLVVLYILFTLAMCIITPYEEIDIINGIMNCFVFTFPGSVGKALYIIIGIVFLYTLLTQQPSWMQAAGYMAVESSKNHELPKVYGTTTKKGAPFGSIVLMGIVGTIVIIVYGILASVVGDSAADLFWTLFSFVSLIFLLPFLFCFSAFIHLRKNDKETVRPFRFPGPEGLAVFAARFCQAVLIFTMLMFFWVPGYPIDWVTDIGLGIGFIISLGFGEYFNIRRKRILSSEEKK